MQWLEAFGYLGALLTVATFSMKTMLRLRLVGIGANVSFICYGALAHVPPVLVLHLVLLPLNVFRLHQLRRVLRGVAAAEAGGVSFDWLRPYSRTARFRAGDVVFRRDDPADQILFVLAGRFRAVEADVAMGPGEVMGELGLITDGRRRTQTVTCEADGELLRVGYDDVRRLYYEDPRFGFYFLQLAARRLLRDAGHRPSGTPAPPPAEIRPRRSTV